MFVDEFTQAVNDETRLIGNRNEGKRWIAAAKKSKPIFVELELSDGVK